MKSIIELAKYKHIFAMNAESIPKTENANVIKSVIAPITKGFKPAASRTHDVIRILMIVAITGYIIYLGMHDDSEDKCIQLDEVSDIIKPGTLIYQTAEEMDDATRHLYLKSMVPMLTPNPPVIKKYIKSFKFALIAGLLSEYIVNGGTSKLIGVVTKTILYTIIYNISNDD